MRVLVLSGPPAVGKSTLGRLVAAGRPGRCAFIDVDDVRQLVVSGMVAPWKGEEGRRQRWLSAVNACGLARNFVAAGIDVVIADVLDAETLSVYRELLERRLVVRLDVAFERARERAERRPVYLSWEEFAMLHREQEAVDGADVRVDTTGLSVEETAARVVAVWKP
ncbi:shikimate kinase [Nonomuraea solani]|uniref:Shikimate kinase n=1 Tax=Nonomuraea solani TaxID=1144553 RepID=A0A1H6F0T3_9ACTN|nr:shikimate kinase [Nonomuraea solani]SEH02715.1 shikimate kinase [Nonomuraea solani]